MTTPTILIADDDTDLVELLARHCRALGYGVDTAPDALTALRKIDQVRPALVILDINMPGGNGLSVREMMADNNQLSSIPVIILTGKTDEQVMRRCFESCAYYVAKCPDVWSRIEPLVHEILEGAPGGESSDAVATEKPPANPYENSDQKVFFDWI
ncbi:MAG: response regulator, partial [Planctomycetaceae bacterium]|nr:response regulator [Planctomycetaceae bacterium]